MARRAQRLTCTAAACLRHASVAESVKRRSGEAAERQSGKVAKRQSGKAAKRQSAEAAKRSDPADTCSARLAATM
jgi:hypothetical protein